MSQKCFNDYTFHELSEVRVDLRIEGKRLSLNDNIWKEMTLGPAWTLSQVTRVGCAQTRDGLTPSGHGRVVPRQRQPHGSSQITLVQELYFTGEAGKAQRGRAIGQSRTAPGGLPVGELGLWLSALSRKPLFSVTLVTMRGLAARGLLIFCFSVEEGLEPACVCSLHMGTQRWPWDRPDERRDRPLLC